MSTTDLIAFARRDWAAIASAKARHWLRRKRTMTSGALWQQADEWWRHARRVRGVGPSESERVADVQIHHRVGQALRAVTRAAR